MFPLFHRLFFSKNCVSCSSNRYWRSAGGALLRRPAVLSPVAAPAPIDVHTLDLSCELLRTINACLRRQNWASAKPHAQLVGDLAAGGELCALLNSLFRCVPMVMATPPHSKRSAAFKS